MCRLLEQAGKRKMNTFQDIWRQPENILPFWCPCMHRLTRSVTASAQLVMGLVRSNKACFRSILGQFITNIPHVPMIHVVRMEILCRHKSSSLHDVCWEFGNTLAGCSSGQCEKKLRTGLLIFCNFSCVTLGLSCQKNPELTLLGTKKTQNKNGQFFVFTRRLAAICRVRRARAAVERLPP